ncbi:hypothetical protein ACWDXD_24785 [Streptomyces sp. NPDC003314]
MRSSSRPYQPRYARRVSVPDNGQALAMVALLLLVAVLLCAYIVNASEDHRHSVSPRSCPRSAVAVDPVTCRPYSAGSPATNNPGSSARQPTVRPAAPAVRAPAAPPRLSKRR